MRSTSLMARWWGGSFLFVVLARFPRTGCCGLSAEEGLSPSSLRPSKRVMEVCQGEGPSADEENMLPGVSRASSFSWCASEFIFPEILSSEGSRGVFSRLGREGRAPLRLLSRSLRQVVVWGHMASPLLRFLVCC